MIALLGATVVFSAAALLAPTGSSGRMAAGSSLFSMLGVLLVRVAASLDGGRRFVVEGVGMVMLLIGAVGAVRVAKRAMRERDEIFASLRAPGDSASNKS